MSCNCCGSNVSRREEANGRQNGGTFTEYIPVTMNFSVITGEGAESGCVTGAASSFDNRGRGCGSTRRNCCN